MTFDDLKIKNIDYAVKYVPSVMRFSAKSRPNHIIGLQMNGSALHEFGNRSFTIEENGIYFLNQAEDYDVEVIEKGLAYSIHFTTYERIDTESFTVKLSNTAEVLRLLTKIDRRILTTAGHHGLMVDFYSLCRLFSEIRQKAYRPKDKRISEMRDYLSNNFRKSGVLDEAASLCGLSRRRFNDVFKNSFDVTPNRYLTGIKVDYAKKLLCSREIGIGDIAEMCGFSDIYYFCKVFKQETGMTPSEFRGQDGSRFYKR